VLEELATLHEIEQVEHGTLEGEKLSLGWPLLTASAWVGQVESLLAFQRDAGRRLFLVSATVESAAELDALRRATAADRLLVVCLSASPDVVAARIDAREPDRWPGKQPLIELARRLALSTPQLPAGDLVIETDGRVAQDVAGEIFHAMRARGMLDARA
jgi:hypothetical protein